jgi:hypothetical protein
MSLRALSLVDVLAQLSQDSGEVVAFNASEVIDALAVDTETLNLTSETLTATTLTDYPLNVVQDSGPVGYWRLDDPANLNEGFESGVTGWTPTGGTFAQSSAQAHSGTKSGLLTVTGSPSQAYVRYQLPVVTAVAYTLTMWCYVPGGSSSVAAAIDWYDSGSNYLSTSSSGGTTIASNTWEQRTLSVTAPPGAAYAQVGPTIGATPTGKTLYLDDVVFNGPVFDSNPWGNTATLPKLSGTVNGTVTFQAAGAMAGSKGATFDGTTGYVECANTASLQRVGDLTIELWFKTTSLSAAQVLVSKGTTGEYHLLLNTNGSISLLMGPSYNTVVVPASTISTGTWYHLVVVRTSLGKKINAYVNGASTYSGTYTTAPSTTTNVMRLGATSPTAGSYFVGTLDEVAIYERSLSATQVSNHHAWGVAADVGSTGYGIGKYGYVQYPTPGAVSGSIYGDPAVIWGGGAIWQ